MARFVDLVSFWQKPRFAFSGEGQTTFGATSHIPLSMQSRSEDSKRIVETFFIRETSDEKSSQAGQLSGYGNGYRISYGCQS